MTQDEYLIAFAKAIAKANGHPDPEEFAAKVAKHYEPPEPDKAEAKAKPKGGA